LDGFFDEGTEGDKMNIPKLVAVIICCGLGLPVETVAAGLGKAVVRGGSKSIARTLRKPVYRSRAFDLSRDRRTPVRVLKQDRMVDRYTHSARATGEVKRGIPSGRHMTSVSTPRPLTAKSARQRLGLSTSPNVVERIRLEKGTPVRFNKVVGGKPGYGEITVPSTIPKASVSRVLKLRP
jgi:hypothetical protein